MELRGAYSNRTDVLFKLTTVIETKATKPGPDQVERVNINRRKRLTKTETKELIRRYEAGGTVYQLGKTYRINRKTVSVILKREGVTTRHRKLTDDDIDRAVELYRSGLSLVDVGALLGVHAGTIRSRIKQRGVDLRPVGANQWS